MIALESEEAVQLSFDAEVMKEMLSALRQLPLQELKRSGSDAVQQAVTFFRAVSQPWADDILLRESVRAAGFLFGLLQSADMSLLQKSVGELEGRCRQWESEASPDALGVFFLKHKTGIALRAYGQTRVQAEEGSAARDEAINALKAQSVFLQVGKLAINTLAH